MTIQNGHHKNRTPDSSRPDNTFQLKLTIRLLFVWTTLSAIGIALTNWGFSGVSGDLRTAYAMTSIAGAAQLTAMGVLLVAWQKNGRMLTEPGHWLAWTYSLGLAYEVLAYGVFSIGSLVHGESSLNDSVLHSFFWMVRNARTFLPIALHSYAAIRHRGLWRLCFILSLLSVFSMRIVPFLFLLVRLFGGQMPFGFGAATLQALASALVLFTAISEYRNGTRRDFLHWIGVLAFTSGGMLFLAYLTVQQFI